LLRGDAMATQSPDSMSLNRPTPVQATLALARIASVWGLDRYDMLALIGASGQDPAAQAWTDDRLLRVAYLVDLDKALIELAPRFGVRHWIATPKPGPFFGGNSPLQIMKGTTRDLAELLRQVTRWKAM
jgi:hypothetical protein